MNRGGLETMLMNYYRQMDRNKIQFDFMVHRPERGHYDDEIEILGGRIFQMPPIRPGNYRTYFKLLKEFFANHSEYRVVHSHINENSGFVLKAAKKAGVPGRIAHSHLSDLKIDYKIPFRLYARFYMQNNPNKLFACSKNAGRWLFGQKRVNSEELLVLNNAVNTQEFTFRESIRRKIREDLGLQNKLVIGHVGRFNEQKNHNFLIEIFNILSQERSDAVLILIGDGDLKDQIEKKVESLCLSERVKFLGIRSDISNLMQAMDLFLFPSLYEGLPVVLVEAQAAGLKCVVSNTITQESDITGGVDFISLKKTPEEWASKILSTSFDRKDTSKKIQDAGYDSITMAKWLSDYYSNYYVLQKN